MRKFIYRYSKYPHQPDKRDFYYVDTKKKRINKLEANVENRIRNMKIPPAYHPVKISLSPNSKILAIGVDKKGKKQYIYNPCWVSRREKEKYCQLKHFARQLPKIKAKIQKYLRQPRMTPEKMIAVILQIILSCHFRVGNDVGRDVYNSYGITTITKKQLDIKDRHVTIKFVGKRGVTNKCAIKDKKMVEILKQLAKERRMNEPLFTYKEPGKAQKRRINAKDVNGFLKSFGDFTSKYFRTWVANVEFIDEIMERYLPVKKTKLTQTARKKILRESIVATAEKLYHTPAICKKSYVSDDLWNLFLEKPRKFDNLIVKYYKNSNNKNQMDPSENAFTHFLEDICHRN